MIPTQKLHITLSYLLFGYSTFLCFVLGFTLIQNILFSFSAAFIFILGCVILKANKIFGKSIILSALFGFSIILTVSILDYYVSVYEKGTTQNPYLLESDAELYHQLGITLGKSNDWGQAISSASATSGIAIEGKTINYIGYPLVLGFVYRYIYDDLITGLILSLFIGFMNIVLIAIVTYKIFNSFSITSKAVLLAGISSHVSSTSVIVLKDVFIINAVLLLLLTVLEKWQLKSIVSLGISLLILFSMRAQLIIILPLFFYIKYGFKGKTPIVLFAIFLILQFISQYTYLTTGNEVSSSGVTEMVLSNSIDDTWVYSGNTSAVNKLVGGYSNLSSGTRLLMLPITILIQYATPFDFWVLEHKYPSFILEGNFNVIWFLFSGPLTIFSLWYAFKDNNIIFQRICMIAIALYAGIAFTYAGVIPRYTAPFIPMFIISAAWAWENITVNKKLKKSWQTFYATYTLLIVIIMFAYIAIKANVFA